MKNSNLFGNSTAKRLLIKLYNNHGQHRNNYASKLAREIDCTYAGCVDNSKILEEIGVITKTVDGRKIILTITDKGKEIAKHLIKIDENLK